MAERPALGLLPRAVAAIVVVVTLGMAVGAILFAQAVAQFAELDPPPVPSVVLLDNRMPRLTGLDAAEQILSSHPQQLVVLFSAHLDSHVTDRARELGVAACFSKVDTAKLPRILRGLLPAS